MTNTLTLLLEDEAATLALATKVSRAIKVNMAIIFLHGPLGAGKTTFSRGFLRGLGYSGTVKSPTYTLVESYVFETVTVFHFDLYRVNDPHELEYMGIRDYFLPNTISLIEWPECGGELLPAPDLSCYIALQPSGREIKIVANSTRGEEILGTLLAENN